jgi:hypothetical protein
VVEIISCHRQAPVRIVIMRSATIREIREINPYSRRPIDPHELPGKRLKLHHGAIDSIGKSRGIGVGRADHDAKMVGAIVVQSNKMPAVHGKNRALLPACKVKDRGIGCSLISQAAFLNRQDIVSQPPEAKHGVQREIFVGVKPRHVYAASLS